MGLRIVLIVSAFKWRNCETVIRTIFRIY